MSTQNDAFLIRDAAGSSYAKNTWTVGADSTTVDIFSIENGPVVVTFFMGIVTTAIGANTDFDIILDPDDTGTDVVLASTLQVDSDVTGATYALNTTANGALVKDLDEAYNASLATPIALSTGDLAVIIAGGGGGTGVVDWYVGWYPLDDGNILVAV